MNVHKSQITVVTGRAVITILRGHRHTHGCIHDSQCHSVLSDPALGPARHGVV
jgi:hypothetical protein